MGYCIYELPPSARRCILGIDFGFFQILLQAVFFGAHPIIRPDMNVHIINMGICMNLFKQLYILLATVLSSLPVDQVIAVNRLNERSDLGIHLAKVPVFLGKKRAARYQSARHDCRIIYIFYMCIPIDSRKDMFT